MKQLRVQDPESFRMMQREAMVYGLADHEPDFVDLKRIIPPFFNFEDDSKLSSWDWSMVRILCSLTSSGNSFPSSLVKVSVMLWRFSIIGSDADYAPPLLSLSLRGKSLESSPRITTGHSCAGWEQDRCA